MRNRYARRLVAGIRASPQHAGSRHFFHAMYLCGGASAMMWLFQMALGMISSMH